MPSSLIAPLVVSGISAGANALLSGGNKSSSVNFTPPGFNAGGLSTTFGNNGYGVTADAGRTAAVNNVASTFGGQADALGGLRAGVAPGYSAFRMAGLNDLENARTASIGNLRDNLARRRVLGSSFGQDAAARTEAEFGKQKASFEAATYLQELEATSNLIQQEFTSRRGQFQTALDEMNLEANLAASLTGKASDVLGKNAQMDAQLSALAQQGQGKFFGQLIQPIAKAGGDGAASFFKGFGSGSSGPDLAGGIWPA